MIVWVISDDSYRAVQALEVAKRLADNPLVFSYSNPPESHSMRPLPDIVIGSGEETAEVVLAVKRQARCYAAIILDPRRKHSEFDLIILPGYEPYPALSNVLLTTGLINHITPEVLQNAIRKFNKNPYLDLEKSGLRPPYLTILLGGKHVGGNITAEDSTRLASIANKFARENNAAILVATCKRSEQASEEALKNGLTAPNFFYEYNGARDIPNPYILFLALADAILVTGDSVRMCSEAAGSGKPLFIYDSDNIAFRYKKLHAELFDGSYAWPYEELNNFNPSMQIKFLDEVGRIAEYIKRQKQTLSP